jgi:hypothetical protein
MSLSFLTPTAVLVSLAAVVPLAAAARGSALSARVRSTLGLPRPSRRAVLPYVALAAVVLCLGLAAGQPVLTRTSTAQVRSDAQVLFVVDVSQSMAAAAKPGSPTRLERARDVTQRLRASIPDVEAGVATLTDRVLPDLLPVPDGSSFDSTLTRSVGIEEPPPLEAAVRATSFGALEDVGAGNYFAPSASKRVVVLVTDGESRPFDESRVARALARAGDVSFAAIRVGEGRESIYDETGKPDTAYVPDPSAGSTLAALAAATGGRAFTEREVGDAAAFLDERLGTGPTRATDVQRKDEILLAPLLAALALVPLALLALRRDGVGAPLVGAIRRLV